MVQATTPTFILTLPKTVDLSIANNLYFTLTQGCTQITKQTNDLSVDGQNVSVYLTQSESLLFCEGIAYMQLNWTYADGQRACSKIKTVPIDNNLLKAVIE